MKRAIVFPGQGAQYVGMGKKLYDHSPLAKKRFEIANEVLGFSLSDIMFHGTEDDLKMTKVTQPAVFLHSMVSFEVLNSHEYFSMTAGHSLGEFTALAASGTLSFEDALLLVSKRAHAMQKACEETPSTMACIIGGNTETIEEICRDITENRHEVVVPANYNNPSQLVISGSLKGIEEACVRIKESGAKRVLPLKVSGAFHSPLMLSAQDELATAIEQTKFSTPSVPVYQNYTALPSTDPGIIKENLIKQLTSPVLWIQQVHNMIADGATRFTEFGPGQVLQGLIRKIDPSVEVDGARDDEEL